MRGTTYVTRARVQCLRTGPGAALVGVAGTTVYLAGGRREARAGTVGLQREATGAFATYQIDRGRRATCGTTLPPPQLLLPARGRIALSGR